MDDESKYYVGIDWAPESHQVCVLDAAGRKVCERSVKHDAEEVARFLKDLERRADFRADCVHVGIEIPRGALVDAMVEKGFRVYAINPKQLDRLRDRHTVAGAKDDRLDAFVLADSLRNDLHLFRRVSFDHPLAVQIRELARCHDDLRDDLRTATNRLRDLLLRGFPQLLELCRGADEEWVWDLVERYPDPASAARMTPAEASAFLRGHRLRRFSVERFLGCLRRPTFRLIPGAREAIGARLRTLLPQIRVLAEQLDWCEAQMKNLLVELTELPDDEPGHPTLGQDSRILLSMPSLGVLIAVAILGEYCQGIEERNFSGLRACSGVAPITRQSGGRRHVTMRRACNQRLRNALYYWALGAIQKDPLCRRQYQALRAKGHGHARALRSVADSLLRVLAAALRTGTPFDPAHPRRVARLDAAA